MVETFLDLVCFDRAFAGEDEFGEFGDSARGKGAEKHGCAAVSVSIMEYKHEPDSNPCAEESKDSQESVPVVVFNGTVVSEVEDVEEREIEQGEDDKSDENDGEGSCPSAASSFLFDW